MKYLDGGQLTFLLSNSKSNLIFLSATSAFVGLATMVVLFPVPGYIAKKVRDVQVQRMKMVLSYLKCLLFFLTVIFFSNSRWMPVCKMLQKVCCMQP